jgi:hypothetical protein
VLAYQVRWTGNGGTTWSTWSTVWDRNASCAGLVRGHAYSVQVRPKNRLGLGQVVTASFVQAR